MMLIKDLVITGLLDYEKLQYRKTCRKSASFFLFVFKLHCEKDAKTEMLAEDSERLLSYSCSPFYHRSHLSRAVEQEGRIDVWGFFTEVVLYNKQP